MQIAVMTMVYQEIAFLRQWIQHYEPLVGRANLYILTHGGHENVIEVSQGCRLIFVPRRNVDWRFDRLRISLMNAYANVLLNNYDCVISGDVDELVFTDPAVCPSLGDLIEQHKDQPIMTAFGLHFCEDTDDLPFDRDRPVFAQRHLGAVDAQYCKPHIVFSEPNWTRGFHGSSHVPNLVDGLYMAHLKFAFRTVSRDVSSSRQKTFDSFGNLGNKSLQRFWGKGEMVTTRMYKAVKSLEHVELDCCINEMRDDLRSNVVKNYAGRGGIQ